LPADVVFASGNHGRFFPPKRSQYILETKGFEGRHTPFSTHTLCRRALMFDASEDLGNRLRIQLRAVGGDPAQGQPAAGQGRPEAAEESPDIPLSRVVVEDLVAQPLEGAVIDEGQDAEGSVVQFISGDVPGEAVEGPIEVIVPDAMGRLFPPRPPPSSGWWRRGRRRGGRARGANWRRDRVSRPRRPAGRPGPRPDGCSGPWARPGRTYRQ